MTALIDYTRQKTSWTKYDMVQVIDIIASEDRIHLYMTKKLKIDESVLKAFLGVNSLSDRIPQYWLEIQNFPEQKKIFGFLSALFTNGRIVKLFAEKYTTGEMKGDLTLDSVKEFTNLRRALVEAGASAHSYLKSAVVPYDFSSIFRNGEVGKLFKQLIMGKLQRLVRNRISEADFYSTCFLNKFPQALGLSEKQFQSWVEGEGLERTASLQQSKNLLNTNFLYQFDKFVKLTLSRLNIASTFELQYKSNEFFLTLRHDVFSKNNSIFDELQNVIFSLPGLTRISMQYSFSDIVGKKIENISESTLQLYQHFFLYDITELQEDPIFKRTAEILKKAYPSKVNNIRIKNFYSIDNIRFENLSDSNEIYLLGENGDGKSLILMAIYLAYNRSYIINNTEQESTGKVKDILFENTQNKEKALLLIAQDNYGVVYGKSEEAYLRNFLAYGAHRGRYDTDRADEYGFMTLFDGNELLINPVSWLKDLRLRQLQNGDLISSNRYQKFQNNINLSISAVEKLLFEILERNVSVEFDDVEVFFVEKGSRVKFEQLSDGYKSIIIFTCDLIFRFSERQPNAKSVRDLHGVVLIDEIDLHLHPKWQLNLVGKLRKLFPKIQFIMTTHSPAIIQGAGKDSLIYRIYRNPEDGVTKTSEVYFRKDLDHLMINSLITSPLFGLDNARMNPKDEMADSSDSYLISKMNEAITAELQKQKNEGKEFVSEKQIDQLIKKILDQELKNDQNK